MKTHSMLLSRIALVVVLLATMASAQQPTSIAPAEVEAVYPEMEKLYLDLHKTPELSQHEEKTSAKMAEGLRKLGYEVTTSVGGYGVVGVLKNGAGKTVLIRTDMDALPVLEQTGLPYASTVRTKDDSGAEVPVMHACGHDFHMASWMGTATLMAKNKSRWRGTLIMVGQPDEEKVGGARAMIKDGLLTRFPRPDYAIAIHDDAGMAAGTVSVTPGFLLASSTAINVTIFGRGGHGAHPHTTIDPVLIAARTILALQTIVSREMNPLDPAVVTVGSIHGGTKGNIIPDQVKLEMTVRAYKEEARLHILKSIERIVNAEAQAAGADRMPEIKSPETTLATYNDPELAKRVEAGLKQRLGADKLVTHEPVMGAEDFSEFGHAGIPALIMFVGAVEPKKLAEAKEKNLPLPSLHSSKFAPEIGPTLRMGMLVETNSALELLGK
jgi:amidohydrolase